jgi:hypothetical protein
MNSTRTLPFRLSTWVLLLAPGTAFGQAVAGPHTIISVATVLAAPTVTILTAATGALVRNQAAGNASLDFGRVAYFTGTSAPGESIRTSSKSFLISTRFSLRVDCPGSPSSAHVSVSMARMDASASHMITIDGNTVALAAQPLVPFMRCGSSSEHRLDVEVPVSTPAGSIGSSVVFVATIDKQQ